MKKVKEPAKTVWIKPWESEEGPSEEFKAFAELTKKVLQVPKSEVDAKRKKVKE